MVCPLFTAAHDPFDVKRLRIGSRVSVFPFQLSMGVNLRLSVRGRCADPKIRTIRLGVQADAHFPGRV